VLFVSTNSCDDEEMNVLSGGRAHGNKDTKDGADKGKDTKGLTPPGAENANNTGAD
jgi:hypothetical protein